REVPAAQFGHCLMRHMFDDSRIFRQPRAPLAQDPNFFNPRRRAIPTAQRETQLDVVELTVGEDVQCSGHREWSLKRKWLLVNRWPITSYCRSAHGVCL